MEYHRNLKQSLMTIETQEYYDGYELDMCRNNRIEGLLAYEVVVADGRMQFWYDITGKQSLETVLSVKPLTVQLLETLIHGIAVTAERIRPYLLDDNKLLLRPDTIYFDGGCERVEFTYCPAETADITVSFRQIFEYLLPKLDYADDRAVQKTYELYQAAMTEQAGIDRLSELISHEAVRIQPPPEKAERISQTSHSKPAIRTKPVIQTIPEESERNEECEQPKTMLWKRSFKQKTPHMRADSQLLTQIQDQFAGVLQLSKKRKKEQMKQLVFEPEPEEQVVEHPTVYLGGQRDECEGKLSYCGNGAGENFLIGEESMVVGSLYGDADVRLSGEGVSRIHARLGRDDQGDYYVEDQNSVNGTYVNGVQLTYHQRYPLAAGDEIIFAKERYRFS